MLAMDGPTTPAATPRARLREIADEQHGYVTTRDAQALGLERYVLPQLARRGFLRNAGYGVYRFADARWDRGADFMEAILLVGPGSYLVDVSVLDLLELGYVSKAVIHVGTRRRVRRTLPETIQVTTDDHSLDDITTYDDIPIVTPARAILDSRGMVMTERLVDAAREANRRGLLGISEMERVIGELGHG